MVRILVIALETMFALGVVGSFVVLILTSIEDLKTLFHGDKAPEGVGKASDTRARAASATSLPA